MQPTWQEMLKMPEAADPIETLLDTLLPRLQAFDRIDRRWFAEALLDDLGCVYGIGAHDDDIENIRDVGEGFITAVALAVQWHPKRTAEVYRAAHEALVGLLDVVQEALCNE